MAHEDLSGKAGDPPDDPGRGGRTLPDIPRRARLTSLTPAELTIRNAIHMVEALPADVRLTDAVVLLGAAGDSVADFVDGIDTRRFVTLNTASVEAPYKVVQDRVGCECCFEGRSWTVETPDGVALGQSFGEEEEAESLAALLNEAFQRGQTAARQ